MSQTVQKKKYRKKYQQLFTDIQTVLFEDWDPIGINDMAPRDEYDSYIGRITGALSKHASVEVIDKMLRNFERDAMGIYSDADQRHPAVLKLKKLGDIYFR